MLISTPRDDNRTPTTLGTLDSDGITVASLIVDPTTHRLKISDGTTGNSLPFTNAQRDANGIPTIWGVSSADGVTPIPIYCDSLGKILTKSM